MPSRRDSTSSEDSRVQVKSKGVYFHSDDLPR